jgi:hypothetical protein
VATSSVREQILVKLATLLTAAGGFTFYRSREAPVSREEGLVGSLVPEEEAVGYQASRQTLRTLVVKVTIIARADVPDSLADPALVAIHAAIMADPTLGGLCAIVVDESTRWTFEVADRNAAAIEMRYRIKYATRFNDLTTPA